MAEKQDIASILAHNIADRRKKELEEKFSLLETVWEQYNVYDKGGSQ